MKQDSGVWGRSHLPHDETQELIEVAVKFLFRNIVQVKVGQQLLGKSHYHALRGFRSVQQRRTRSSKWNMTAWSL